MDINSKPFQAFQYSSITEFFQDYYEYLRSQDESFSFSKIAELCSFRSRTEARNLVKGIKKLSTQNIKSLNKSFPVTQKEQDYLILLNSFEQVEKSAEATKLFEKLVSLQKEEITEKPFREIEITASVLHMTLLSIFDLSNTPQDSKEISKLLKNRYKPIEIEQAIQELNNYGFIEKENSKWIVKQKFVKNYDFKSNIFLQKFHSECMEIAEDALFNEEPTERYLVGASFCINSKVFPRIIQKMNTFVENLMMLEGVAGENDTVVQFNQQLVKMTDNKNSKLVTNKKSVECLTQ